MSIVGEDSIVFFVLGIVYVSWMYFFLRRKELVV